LTKATTELGLCQVRSGTDRPCTRSAAVKIGGVPFCEPCARQQEAYFAVGELTETSRCLHNDSLVQMMNLTRSIRRGGIPLHPSPMWGSTKRPLRGVRAQERIAKSIEKG
jgi:hypothetical protein